MSLHDFQIVDKGGHEHVPTRTWRTDAGSTAINAGEFVKLDSAGGSYATVLANNEGTTTQIMLGLAKSTSTHTATADGTVEVYAALPGIVYRGAATTVANIDTDAELLVIEGNRISLDQTGGAGTAFTFDENEADATTNAFTVVGGDINAGTLDCELRMLTTISGNPTT